MKKIFISAVVLFCAAASVFGAPVKKARVPAAHRTVAAKPVPAVRPAPASAVHRAPGKPVVSAGYRPAGTVAFANLDLIAKTVAGIAGQGSLDPVLTQVIPRAIRGQVAAKLFGPMRKGAHGVAVCYVDPAIAARVAAAKKPSDSDLDRAKRWCVVYPATVSREVFRQKHPEVVPDANGTLKLPPGAHSRRTFWVWFSPDGQWAALAPSPSMAAHAFGASAAARVHPLGADLAYVRMDVQGARAVFGSDLFADGELSVRMTPAGLELRASARKIAMNRAPLPRGATSFAGIPPNAPLFGVTTTPSDVKTAEDLFGMAGPEFGAFVHHSIKYLNMPGMTGYYLNDISSPAPATPRVRLMKILPEAQSMPVAANAMFCSPTTVLKLCLPKVAAKLMPMDSAQLHVALRLLRKVRGDGLGCMSWREGNTDKLLIRISRDELYGTANLWSMSFL